MDDNLKEIEKLQAQVDSKKLPGMIKDYIDVSLERVARSSKYGNYSYEYEAVSRYIYWVTSIPWGEFSKDDLDLEHAKKTLNENHYGMETIKERVLEFLAVMNLKKTSNSKTPIICFVGLQGIGKTTMAKSIALALGRSFERVSLGGMPSALELLGRSRANADSEPGLIAKALIRAKTMNPVMLLDELDKTGNDIGSRASVMASLLEILDPEQNATFMDNYIGFPMDLSQVFFVLTANNLGGISNALLDRLEIIKLTGYSDTEKQTIAKEFLLPKVFDATGVSKDQLIFSDDVWPSIIRPLGYEAGIRELERVLMSVARKVAKKLLENPSTVITITPDNVKEYIASV